MLIYIIIYSLLLISGIVDSICNFSQKQKITIFIFWIISFTLFRGLRWETGTDWEQFYYCFQHTTWDNIFTYSRYGEETGHYELMEFGYMFLNWFIGLFGNYTVFLIITNFLVLISYSCFALKCVPKYSILTFAMILVFNRYFPVRLDLANSIMIWALYYILMKNFWKYLIVVLLAFTIHKSALLFLPFFFILRMSLPWYIIISGYLFISLFVSVEFLTEAMSLLGEKMLGINAALSKSILMYTMASPEPDIMITRFFSIFLCVFFLSIFCFCRKKIKDKKTLFYYNVLLNTYLFFNIFYRLFSNDVLQHYSRFTTYFLVSYPILVVLSFSMLEKQIPRRILIFCIVLFYLYKFYGMTLPYPELHYPYHSVF
jgi:hypothetical protein